MKSAITLADAGGQKTAHDILIGIAVIVGFCIVIGIAATALGVVAEHVRGVPNFAKKYPGQFIALLALGVIAGLALTAKGVNPAVAFAVGAAASLALIIFVSG